MNGVDFKPSSQSPCWQGRWSIQYSLEKTIDDVSRGVSFVVEIAKNKIAVSNHQRTRLMNKISTKYANKFDSALKIFPLFCYLEFDGSYNEGDQREERPCFAIVDLIIIVWLLFLFLFRSVMPSLCLGNWWLVCFSIAFSFSIFCHCLFVFTTLICLMFDLTAHFLSLFVLTDAVEVVQTVWVVFGLSGWQLPKVRVHSKWTKLWKLWRSWSANR